MRRLLVLLVVLWLVASPSLAQLPPSKPASQTGNIVLSGSSALAPLTENIATLYTLEGFRGDISVNRANTSDAFIAFCQRNTDIVMADRLITPDEATACASAGITPIAFRVATDALIVAVSGQNNFLVDLTAAELQLVFSSALNWSDVRPNYPIEPITRYLSPADSSETQFLISALFGGDASRLLTATNNNFSSDASALLQGLQSSPFNVAILSASVANRNSSLVRFAILDGITPTTQAVTQNQYPLTRPLVLYSTADIFSDKPQVADFMNYYLTNVNAEVAPLGLYPAGDNNLSQAQSSWFAAVGQPQGTPSTVPTAEPSLLPVTTEQPLEAISAPVGQEPPPAVPATNEDTLLLLIDARNDLELLAANAFGISRPEGWNGSFDASNPQFALIVRLDLETAAANAVSPTQRPQGWFGAVASTSYAIARDVRHDLELLADAVLGENRRPEGWRGGAPLLRCSRATQALVNLLERGGVYRLQVSTDDPDYCRKAEVEAAQFSEVNLLNNPSGEIFSPQAQPPVAGLVQIKTNFAVAFLDRGAALQLGVIPNGTSVLPIARSYTRFSNMTLVQGEGFLVFVDYKDTTLDDASWRALPDVSQVTEPTFCNAEWCTPR